MFSAQLSCFLTVFLFCSAATAGAQKVITASRGDNVTLPCSSVFNYSDQVSVEWKKDRESLCTYRTQNNKTSAHNCKPRYKVNIDPVGLILRGVTRSDAGVYNCTMSRLIPPPSVDGSLLLILQVNEGLLVEQMNSSNLTCVELLCSLEGLSPEQVHFTWARGSEQLLHQNSSSSMSSTLKLCKPNWRDGDTVTCSASYSSNHTVYKSLLKSFTIKCSNSDCTETGGVPWLLIGSVVGVCVVLFFIILCVVSYKCKKKKDGSGSIVFTNKIYENLSFFSPRVSAEPGVGLTPRTHARPNPQGECQPQREECIYEN